MHIDLRMRVFGEEYWANEMLYSCTKIETVEKVQTAIAQALLALNKTTPDLKLVKQES